MVGCLARGIVRNPCWDTQHYLLLLDRSTPRLLDFLETSNISLNSLTSPSSITSHQSPNPHPIYPSSHHPTKEYQSKKREWRSSVHQCRFLLGGLVNVSCLTHSSGSLGHSVTSYFFLPSPAQPNPAPSISLNINIKIRDRDRTQSKIKAKKREWRSKFIKMLLGFGFSGVLQTPPVPLFCFGSLGFLVGYLWSLCVGIGMINGWVR